ncbi:hypothetical protein [Segatella copri]|uniref:Double-GTPase 1 domain-containing protein n=1 Tax=Segatella copri TaxID=165179 RepID=A0A6G1VKG8_9BACT|nr:hypothetical protein [Segatella copri]MQN58788.1 hypothetical protein [Segatella copri]MQP13929.1 hypothetical protein [Segatella copri]
MIAGLPGSGKSTYIGALWYCLMHPEKIEGIKMVADKMNLADDLTVLNRLSDAYKYVKLIDRNYSDQNETVQINLKVADSDTRLQVEIPDFLGENFRDLVELKESELVSEWLKDTDTLVYFMNEVTPPEFEDDHGPEDDDSPMPAKEVPQFSIKTISAVAMNIMVLKCLLSKKSFKKVVIVLSWWDQKTNNGTTKNNPQEYLKDNSPALFNFIQHHIPNFEIIGLSAQGQEYPKEDQGNYEVAKKEIKAKMREGKRSFVEIEDEIIHDLSLPLYLLIKE